MANEVVGTGEPEGGGGGAVEEAVAGFGGPVAVLEGAGEGGGGEDGLGGPGFVVFEGIDGWGDLSGI